MMTMTKTMTDSEVFLGNNLTGNSFLSTAGSLADGSDSLDHLPAMKSIDNSAGDPT